MTQPVTRTCQECGMKYKPTRREAMFCRSACKTAFHHRRHKRGAEIYDLMMTMRYDRERAAELGVWATLCRMAQGFQEEDARDRSGRRSWDDPARVISRKPYLNAIVVNRNSAGARRK